MGKKPTSLRDNTDTISPRPKVPSFSFATHADLWQSWTKFKISLQGMVQSGKNNNELTSSLLMLADEVVWELDQLRQNMPNALLPYTGDRNSWPMNIPVNKVQRAIDINSVFKSLPIGIYFNGPQREHRTNNPLGIKNKFVYDLVALGFIKTGNITKIAPWSPFNYNLTTNKQHKAPFAAQFDLPLSSDTLPNFLKAAMQFLRYDICKNNIQLAEKLPIFSGLAKQRDRHLSEKDKDGKHIFNVVVSDDPKRYWSHASNVLARVIKRHSGIFR